MRKLFILLCILLFNVSLQAQQLVNFKLQVDGTFKSEDNKDFIVIPVEGKSAQELYNMVKINVTSQFNSAKDVLSTVENEMISVNGISQNCISMNAFAVFSIQYVMSFRFKEGKIRVDAPVLSRLFTSGYPDINPISGWLTTQRVFLKDGTPNPKKQKVIDGFENTVNSICNGLITTKIVDTDW